MNIGYNEIVDEVLEEVEERGRDTSRAFDNLDWFEAVLEITEGFKKHESRVDGDIKHLEFGGGAVFAHLFSEVGAEAFIDWRGSDDTDKYFSHDYSDIRSVWRQMYPDSEIKAANNADWRDRYKEKHTAETEINGKDLHCDFVRPEAGDNMYDFEESREVDVGETNIRVPSIYEMVASKMRAPREKDRKDVMNLLYVAEERGIDPEEVRKNIYGENSSLGKKLEDFADSDASRGAREEVSYAPSKEYMAGISL